MSEDETFIVAPSGTSQRWVVHPPIDPHGDGYVHSIAVEISDDHLKASTTSALEGKEKHSLPEFLIELASGWRGWQGTRRWASLDSDLELECRHQGNSVTIAVALHGCGRQADTWSARIVLTVEPGEELNRIANNARKLLAP